MPEGQSQVPEETLFSFRRHVETKLLKEIREVMRAPWPQQRAPGSGAVRTSATRCA